MLATSASVLRILGIIITIIYGIYPLYIKLNIYSLIYFSIITCMFFNIKCGFIGKKKREKFFYII